MRSAGTNLRIAALLVAAVAVVAGCGGKKGTAEIPASELYDPGPGNPSAPPPSEASRTREMDAKKREMERIETEARATAMTPEQVEQAYRDYERERLEMNQLSETAAAPPPDTPPAEDPPPPR